MDNSSLSGAGAAWILALQGLLIATAVAAGLFVLNLWPKPQPSDKQLVHEKQLAYENARTIPFERAFDMGSIDLPPTYPAPEAKLDDDQTIIGVSAGGRFRAYSVSALSQGPRSHIVNDVLESVPVSVTYCDLRDCVRVFTGQGRTALALRQGGLYQDKMVLRVRGHSYFQESLSGPQPNGAAAFTYEDYPYVWTTWGTWRKLHPATDIYLEPPYSQQGPD